MLHKQTRNHLVTARHTSAESTQVCLTYRLLSEVVTLATEAIEFQKRLLYLCTFHLLSSDFMNIRQEKSIMERLYSLSRPSLFQQALSQRNQHVPQWISELYCACPSIKVLFSFKQSQQCHLDHYVCTESMPNICIPHTGKIVYIRSGISVFF